jgi:hypothetical protein
MANLTPDELTQAITIGDTDLLVTYPAGGPMLACQWSVVKGLMITAIGSTYLVATNNLNDVPSPSTARTNLGLGTASQQNVGTSGANVPLLNALNLWGATQTLVAGTTTLAPLKFLSGTNLTTPVSGVLEYNGTNYFGTDSSATRHTFAYLDSPAFTGTPTGPTAGNSTSNTQLATTAFVATAIANIPAAPGLGVALFAQTASNGSNSTETSMAGDAWVTRVVNTTSVNTISGASLSSNQITLPAGTYQLSASQTYVASGSSTAAKGRWRNVTDGTTAIVGLNAPAGTTANDISLINGSFVITGTKAFSLQFWGQGGSNYAGGNAAASGELETYVAISIAKVA